MSFTKNQLYAFNELGWVVVRRVFDQETIRKIKQELEGIHVRAAGMTPEQHAAEGFHVSWEPKVPAGQPKKIEQLMGSNRVSPTLDALIRRPDILDKVEQILGPEIELYHSKLLMKAPHTNGYFPWHQDYGYWHFGENLPTQVNIAFAIDEQTIENGCLHYVPGSHKKGLLDHLNFKAESFQWGLSTDFNHFEAVPVEYEAGDVCFFGSLVIHGSEINKTPYSAVFNTTAYSQPGHHKDEQAKFEVLRTRK
ncbi:MAG: phytanoyl-CoA dioxygenase family protein [Verrucomicrobiae bacterium]|nr:phytanoyl-CoA dioxygenase family protein [Verrucomicrobiae bacterium]